MTGIDRKSSAVSRRELLALGAGAATGIAGLRGAWARSAPRPGHRTGSFHFQPAGLREIRVYYALGAGDMRDATMVIVMHGDDRDAAYNRDVWAKLIQDKPFVVAAPLFTDADFPGSRQYNQGGIQDEHGAVRPVAQWTFSYIEPLFLRMRAELSGRQSAYNLFGHSAGAQFVHRYVELAPASYLQRALAANAGWYTMTDPAIDFPYGAGGVARSLFDWPTAFKRRLTVMLGDQDILDDENLRHDAGSDAQGLTRWARGNTFFNAATSRANSLGLPFNWDRVVVPGVGHQTNKMSASAIGLLV